MGTIQLRARMAMPASTMSSEGSPAMKCCVREQVQVQTEFRTHRRVKRLFLTEDCKVVTFDEKKNSVQDEGQTSDPWNTWVDYFRVKNNNGRHLVTLIQKIGDRFVIAKKNSNKLEFFPIPCQDANCEPPSPVRVFGKDLEQHLFVLATENGRLLQLQCYKNQAQLLHVSKNSLVLGNASKNSECAWFELRSEKPKRH